MIHIKDKHKINRIYVPKHQYSINVEFKLHLFSTSDNKEYIIDTIDEKPDFFYFTFSVDFGGLGDGEYKMLVEENNQCVSTNLLHIGDISNDNKHFENDKIIKYYE